MRRRRRTLPVLTAVVAATVSGCTGSSGTSPASSHSASASTSARPSTVAERARTSPAPWDRPSNQDAQVTAAHLILTPNETLQVHYHSHLSVTVDGRAVPVVAGLGINAGPNGALPEHGAAGIAPLHTHDDSGVLHVEAPKADRFTLGQAFTLWDVALGKGRIGGYVDGQDGRHVSVFVAGKPYTGDPREITLKDHLDIDIVVTSGSATPAPPKPFDWSTF